MSEASTSTAAEAGAVVERVEPASEAGPSTSSSSEANISDITAALDSLTSHAASLPSKSDLGFHRTLDRKFAKNLDAASEQVFSLAGQLFQLVMEGRDQSAKPGALASAGPSSSSKKTRRKLESEDDVVDGFRRNVGEALDGLLEDAVSFHNSRLSNLRVSQLTRQDSQLDIVSGQKKASALKISPAIQAKAGQKISGPFAPPLSSSDPSSSSWRRQKLPGNILYANIKKPQTTFPDRVDNTWTEWTPSLSDKPHAMVPLGHPIPLISEPIVEGSNFPDKNAVMTARRKEKSKLHPYYYETEHLPYPTRMFEIAPPIPPVGLDRIEPIFVDTPEALEKMITELKAAGEIAVDLEHHSLRSYYGFTCLIQISTRTKDWVVDTLKLRGALREGKLGGVMADPNIVKVFHGAESDIVWLQKDFDIYIVNLFDTYHATHVLEFSAHSLASLLARYCDFAADKRYQMADWRVRPLPKEMLEYARSDTHFLLYIYDRLRNALLEKSSRPPSPVPEVASDASKPEANETPLLSSIFNLAGSVSGTSTPRQNPQAALRRALELSAETALKLYERERYDAESGKGVTGWATTMKKWMPKDSHEEVEGWVFKRLHAWRDSMARGNDESPIYMMPNETLKNISLLRVPTLEVIKRLTSTKVMGASSMADHILSNVEKGRALGAVQVEEANKKKAKEAKERQEALLKPTTSVAEDVVAWRLLELDDLWLGLDKSRYALETPSRSASTSTGKTTSGLFGSTLSSKPQAQRAPSPVPALPAKSTSSLFGNTFFTPQPHPVRTKSPTFEEVSKRIAETFNPTRLVSTPNGDNNPVGNGASSSGASVAATSAAKGEVASAKVEAEQRMEPETVPFVPAGKRSTFANLKDIVAKGKAAHIEVPTSEVAPTYVEIKGATSSNPPESSDQPSSPAPSKKRPKDAILEVKRKRSKKDKGVSTEPTPIDPISVQGSASNAPSAEPTPASAATPAISETLASVSGKAKKKAKKTKVDPASIPEFDYSKQSNLLDNPSAQNVNTSEGGAGQEARLSRAAKKKEKRLKQQKAGAPPPTVIETPDFGRMPRDMTQPKGGGRSKTFTS